MHTYPISLKTVKSFTTLHTIGELEELVDNRKPKSSKKMQIITPKSFIRKSLKDTR